MSKPDFKREISALKKAAAAGVAAAAADHAKLMRELNKDKAALLKHFKDEWGDVDVWRVAAALAHTCPSIIEITLDYANHKLSYKRAASE